MFRFFRFFRFLLLKWCFLASRAHWTRVFSIFSEVHAATSRSFANVRWYNKGKRPTMIKDFINMYVWFSSVFHLIFLTSAVVSYFIHNEFLQIIASNIACSSVWTKWIRWRMNSDIGFVQAWCNDDRNSTYHKLIWR